MCPMFLCVFFEGINIPCFMLQGVNTDLNRVCLKFFIVLNNSCLDGYSLCQNQKKQENVFKLPTPWKRFFHVNEVSHGFGTKHQN